MFSQVLSFSFLFHFYVSSSVHSLECNERQYAHAKQCCDKCKPGEHMLSRCTSTQPTKCSPCPGGRYRQNHNVVDYCDFCYNCNMNPLELESPCSATHDAVCRCKPGYRCTEQPCRECERIPSSTQPTTGNTIRTVTTLGPTSTSTRGDANNNNKITLVVVVVSLLCVGILLIVATSRWIRSQHGSGYRCHRIVSMPSTEEEKVSKPIQEMCGECDQPIDVCV